MASDNHPAGNFQLPANFSGIVRLFPLPNLVLFPGVVQALHIFEPRYRKMMQDSLAGDQTIAMSLIRSETDGSAQTQTPPELCPVICVGNIVAHNELEDGRYNLLLRGVARARIVCELSIEQPYRMAEVDILIAEDDIQSERHISIRQEILTRVQQMPDIQLVEEAEIENASAWGS